MIQTTINAAGAAVQSVPNFLAKVGAPVLTPRGGAIFIGSVICVYGAVAVAVAAKVAKPYVTQQANAVYDWACSMVTTAPTIEGEVIPAYENGDQLPQA